jgi:pimeloyl-ACP methyl ester carboxylesterase
LTPLSLQPTGLAGWRRQQGQIPVLALHGWLDNAGSFIGLSDYLTGIDLVALDLPGHGQSAHRPAGVRYHFDDYVFDVLSAMDTLEWPQCHLLGHSLGGAVSTLLAAAAPDRVSSLSLIEGLGPITTAPDQTAAGWRKALRAARERPRRVHPDLESAVAARARNSDLSLDDARALAQRGTESVDGGISWRHDLRLTWPSTQRYTEAQVLDLLHAIEAPVLNLYSDPPSGILQRRVLERRLAALTSHRLFSCPGGHHLHMHHPAKVGPVIKEFIHEQHKKA